jgi:hypothetical protein
MGFVVTGVPYGVIGYVTGGSKVKGTLGSTGIVGLLGGITFLFNTIISSGVSVGFGLKKVFFIDLTNGTTSLSAADITKSPSGFLNSLS